MAIMSIFKCRSPVMGYTLKAGRLIHFVKHIYATDNESEIKELTELCKEGGIYYIDSDMVTADSEDLNPIAVLKRQMREEILAEQAAANDKERDIGASDTSKLGMVATSSSIMGGAALSGTNQADAVAHQVTVQTATE